MTVRETARTADVETRPVSGRGAMREAGATARAGTKQWQLLLLGL